MLSPIYGDLRGFPPTILTTVRRDLFSQQHVPGHRQAASGRCGSDLHVFEGMFAPQYLFSADAPESKGALRGIGAFFDRYLSK